MGYRCLLKREEPVTEDAHLQKAADDTEDVEISRGDRWEIVATDPEVDEELATDPEVDEELDDEEPTDVAEKSRGKSGSLLLLVVGMAIGVGISIGGMDFVGRGNAPVPTPSAPVPTLDENVSASDATNVELPDPSQTVTVAIAKSIRISRTLEATGTVNPYDLLPILARASGLQIQQVLVDEGDYVTAGQVMAILDDSVVRSRIADAQAQVESLRSSKIQTETGVWQAEAALAQAKAGESEAQAAISQAEAAKSEAEAGLQQAIATKSELEAAVLAAEAGKLEAEAGRDQAVASLGQAEAELAQAKRELERYQELADAGAISRQDLDVRRTRVENASEGVRVAEANIRSADARIQSAIANLSSSQARVSSAAATVSSAEARVSSAIANIRNAEAGLERSAANVSSAQSQVESARATVRSAAANVRSSEAQVEQVRTQQEQTFVRAPASGIVAERIARVGDVTSNSNRLFSIIANGELELHVKVPETQLPRVKTGATVNITSDADSRIDFTGIVREISPLLDADSRQATVKVSLPGSDLLRSGMFLRAVLTTSIAEKLTVPAKAVLPQADGSSIVYLLTENDIVQAQPVIVGQIIDAGGSDLSNASIEIQNGLNVGDPIVVEGAAYLKNGDRVKVVDR